MLTPYQFASNSPIQAIDLDGAEAQNATTGQVDNTLNPNTTPTYQKNKDVKPWSDLMNLKIPESVIQSSNGRFYVHDFVDQKLSDASGTLMNTDYYSVTIDKLPTNFKSAGELFNFVRKNLNSFMQGGGNSFEPYDEGENEVWTSQDPTSAIMRFKGYIAGVNIDDADVVTAKYSYSDKAAYWIFKPVTDVNLIGATTPEPGDAGHPLAGYRQFGVAPGQNGGSIFYTRGVDRTWGLGDTYVGGQNTIFKAADVLWRAVMNNVANYVIMNGGKASVPDPTSRRVDWSKDVPASDKETSKAAGN
jgi:hypothetical protein